MKPDRFPSTIFTRRALLLGTAAAAGATVMGCANSGQDVAEVAATLRRPLDLGAADPILEIVRYATLAGNGHNTQPWTFTRLERGVSIAGDPARRTPVVDPDDHHLYASLGCAA